MEYDVIVIGAGPAGSTFARIAAEHGLNVIIFDKRKEIGNPVRCAEGLGAKTILEQELDLPRYVYSTEIYGAKIVGPNGQEIVLKNDSTRGWVLERKFFDKWLTELATKAGAKVKTYHRVFDVIKENGKIKGVRVSHGGREPFDVYAKLIVSAEGMESLTARKMGFPTVHRLYDVDTCYQYELQPYEHENLIELYFGNTVAPRGYVWVFPKANKKANVGIGIGAHLETHIKKSGIKGADPKHFLDKFINARLGDTNTLLDFGGVISVGAPLSKFTMDNAMVIGTAAKQVDPIHGGGIALAMEAGAMSAIAAAKAFEANDFSEQFLYNHYEKPWRDDTGKKLNDRLKLRKALEKLNDDDLNYIFDNLTPTDLDDILLSKFTGVVKKMLLGRPQLLKVLQPLLMGP